MDTSTFKSLAAELPNSIWEYVLAEEDAQNRYYIVLQPNEDNKLTARRPQGLGLTATCVDVRKETLSIFNSVNRFQIKFKTHGEAAAFNFRPWFTSIGADNYSQITRLNVDFGAETSEEAQGWLDSNWHRQVHLRQRSTIPRLEALNKKLAYLPVSRTVLLFTIRMGVPDGPPGLTFEEIPCRNRADTARATKNVRVKYWKWVRGLGPELSISQDAQGNDWYTHHGVTDAENAVYAMHSFVNHITDFDWMSENKDLKRAVVRMLAFLMGYELTLNYLLWLR